MKTFILMISLAIYQISCVDIVNLPLEGVAELDLYVGIGDSTNTKSLIYRNCNPLNCANAEFDLANYDENLYNFVLSPLIPLTSGKFCLRLASNTDFLLSPDPTFIVMFKKVPGPCNTEDAWTINVNSLDNSNIGYYRFEDEFDTLDIDIDFIGLINTIVFKHNSISTFKGFDMRIKGISPQFLYNYSIPQVKISEITSTFYTECAFIYDVTGMDYCFKKITQNKINKDQQIIILGRKLWDRQYREATSVEFGFQIGKPVRIFRASLIDVKDLSDDFEYEKSLMKIDEQFFKNTYLKWQSNDLPVKFQKNTFCCEDINRIEIRFESNGKTKLFSFPCNKTPQNLPIYINEEGEIVNGIVNDESVYYFDIYYRAG